MSLLLNEQVAQEHLPVQSHQRDVSPHCADANIFLARATALTDTIRSNATPTRVTRAAEVIASVMCRVT